MTVALDALEASLVTNVYFSDTNLGLAEDFVHELKNNPPEQISVLITGDTDINNPRLVSRLITLLCRPLGIKDNFKILTGELSGIEWVARAYAKKNNIDIDVFPMLDNNKPWDTSFNARKERDRRMLANAHIVIVLTKGKLKECNFVYTNAINEGKFVTRRKVKNSGD